MKLQRGAVAVELALVAVPMMLFFLAIFEFAFMLSRYQTISKRVYEASRFISAVPNGVNFESIVPKANSIILHGDPSVDPMTPSAIAVLGNDVIICRCSNAAPNVCGSAVMTPPCPLSTTSNTARTVSVVVDGYTYQPIFSSLGFFSVDFPAIMATMPRLN